MCPLPHSHDTIQAAGDDSASHLVFPYLSPVNFSLDIVFGVTKAFE